MTATYIPYKGLKTQGTWKFDGNGLTVKSSQFGQNSRYVHESRETGRTRVRTVEKSSVNRSVKSSGSSVRVLRASVWFIAILIALYVWNGFVSAQTTTTSYRVKSGDTLWSVAEHQVPNHDPRIVTAQIEKLNHISGTDDIYPGEVLKLPRE